MSDPILLHNFKGHKKPITGLSFHPDDSKFISSSEDRTVMIWDISKQKHCYNLSGHTDAVTCVEFSPKNGQILASASQDRSVRFWVPSVRSNCIKLKAHSSAVRTLTFSSEGKTLYTGSNDKSIKVWDVETRRFLNSFVGHNNWVRALKQCCSTSNPSSFCKVLLSTSDDKTLRLWDLSCGKCIQIFNNLNGRGVALAVHPTSYAVAVGISDGSVRIYDIRCKKLQQYYILHDVTTSVAWHPKGGILLNGGNDGSIKIIDVMEGRPLYTLESHKSAVRCVEFSHDGEFFLSGGEDRFINVWKTNLQLNADYMKSDEAI